MFRSCFFWTLALWAYVNLLERPTLRWAIALGLSLGLGMLAKYAMIYFVLGMLVAAVIDRKALAPLRSRLVWVALGIAAIISAPNLIWVLQHNFVTFRNITGVVQTDKGFGIHPLAALEFFAAQFAVFGPVVFVALVGLLYRPGRADPCCPVIRRCNGVPRCDPISAAWQIRCLSADSRLSRPRGPSKPLC
jgi:4-amino-4-deoxy-L-arabinose transferase-like glycosyltransferase